MSYQFFQLERDEGVGIIKINRPPMNAMSLEFANELMGVAKEASEDEGIKAVVFVSELEKVFSAGADIKMLKELGPGVVKKIIGIQGAIDIVADMPKPVIACINGHALGGGCELSLACDLRFMARGEGTIGLTEVLLGLLPGGGGTQRMARLLGPGKAKELLFTGARLSPEEALAIGLVNRLYEPDKLRHETIAFAKNLARGASIALRWIKKCLNEGLQTDLKNGLRIEREGALALADTDDLAEGIRAFLEKRKPQFPGR